MKNIIYLLISFLIISCGSGLYTAEKLNLKDNNLLSHNFSINDFMLYAYSMCEDSKQETNNRRFFNCPQNFYDIPEEQKILKVEETYLLINSSKNIVIYLTTFSHKYIYSNGFLNNREIYEDKIVLNQIEYAYIGTIEPESNQIHFPGRGKRKDIILYFDPKEYPKTIHLLDGNIATAENHYTIDQKIDLSNVFKHPIKFNTSVVYQIQFYNKKSETKLVYDVDSLNIIYRKDKVELVFGSQNAESPHYKISNKKIRFYNSDNFKLSSIKNHSPH
jgi:hypothetical protein